MAAPKKNRKPLTPSEMAARNAVRRIKKAAGAIVETGNEEKLLRAAVVINNALREMAAAKRINAA